jgi:Tubulin folding cofactor D C terminal
MNHAFTGGENTRSADNDLCQQRHARNSLVTYAKCLPAVATDGGSYYLQALVDDLIAEAKANLSSNTKVIPVLQALNALLEADVLENLCDSEVGIQR